MAGSVEANRKFYDEAVELMLGSGLNSTDVIRVLTAILVQIMTKAPGDQRGALRVQIYNRLIGHMQSIKNGQELVLYAPNDVMPGPSEMHLTRTHGHF